MYYYYGFILIPGILLSIWATVKVTRTFNVFKNIPAKISLKANELIRQLLDKEGLNNIRIIKVRGNMTDYYNHSKKTIALSDSVYDSNSISALSVACHELGHAIQYKNNYIPIKIRNLIIKINSFSNHLLWIILVLGSLFYYIRIGKIFVIIGVGLFAVSVLLDLITLPIEFDASKRAMKLLKENAVLDEEELIYAKKVLNSAALTYVAGFIVSLLNLLRLILIFKDHTD